MICIKIHVATGLARHDEGKRFFAWDFHCRQREEEGSWGKGRGESEQETTGRRGREEGERGLRLCIVVRKNS